MTHLDTEESIVHTLKGAIRKYGMMVGAAVVIVIAAFWGYNLWQHSEGKDYAAASELFEVFMEAREMGDFAKTEEVVNTLKTTYPKTPYANAVELFVASDAVQNGKLADAEISLTWILTEGGNFGTMLARSRLARIQLAQGENEKALETLNSIPAEDYQPWLDEIKGDIELSLGKKAEAATLYEKALQAYLNLGLDVTLVQMKLNQVSGNVTQQGSPQ